MLIIRIEHSDDKPASSCIIQANPAAEKLLGFSEKDLINRQLDSLFSIKDPLLWQTALASIAQTDTHNCFEAELISQPQEHIPILLSLSPLPKQTTSYIDSILLIQCLKPDNDVLVMSRVVEQSTSAIMITDRNGCIEYINPKFTALTGYTADELLGQNPKILQSGNMPKEHYQSMWKALTHHGEWQGEIQNTHKNGNVYWVRESISAIKNSMGEITHFLAIEDDITRRKAVESALTESVERFRQMAELSGEWLWEQDPEGYYLYSSSAVMQILGFSQEQIIGRHYTALLTTQDKESQTVFSTSHHAFKALINHYQHKDGHQVLTESTGLPIFDADGKLLKWRGVDRDITARMHFQTALIESEKRTRLIIDSSMNAIVIMDSDGLITDWNHSAEKIFGWSANEAIGQRLDRLIMPERFHKAHHQGLQNYLHTGVWPILNQQTEQITKRRDGSEFPIELSVSPLKVGNAYIFSCFIHDISGRKSAEQQIRQAHINLAIAQNEIKIAQEIQATLSPSTPIKTNDFEITGFCVPADKVGGDYYDYFFRHDTLLDIVIADVSGHSIGPALFMVETRSALRAQNNPSATPAETLGLLNNFLFVDLDHSDYFITLFYLQVDLEQHRLSYANAGHPPPLLFNGTRATFKELDADGLIVGIQQNVVFEEKSLPLTAGDVILFYTDGLIEAENAHQEFFGLERVKTIFCQNAQLTPQAIMDALFAELQQFCQRTSFTDDITLMVFKWR